MKTEKIEIDGQTILIAGADEMDKSQLEEIKDWQKGRTRPKRERGGIKPIDAYRELKERKEYNKKKQESGHGRIF